MEEMLIWIAFLKIYLESLKNANHITTLNFGIIHLKLQEWIFQGYRFYEIKNVVEVYGQA